MEKDKQNKPKSAGRIKAEKNLIPNEARTPKQRRENARKAGKASAEARKKKKLLKDCLDILLEKDYTDKKGNKASGAEALASTLFKKALAGDLKAFELVRDTAGQKPVDRVMISEVDQATIDEVEKMMNEADDEE